MKCINQTKRQINENKTERGLNSVLSDLPKMSKKRRTDL